MRLLIQIIATILISTSLTHAEEYSATYELSFNANWSSSTHPSDFPNGAHFSGLIGNTHISAGIIWQHDQLASDGIEQMAETGGRSILTNEINSIVSHGHAEHLILGPGATASDTVEVQFEISESHPLLSMVTMIAPSPDWFLGISGVNLLSQGEWRKELTIDLYPYDAGTDNGTTFTSANEDSDPAVPIFELNTYPFSNEIPLGTFSIALISAQGTFSEITFQNGFE